MKKNLFAYLLLSVVLYTSCSGDNNGEEEDGNRISHFTISVKDKTTESYLPGAIYRVFDENGGVIGTYTSEDGVIEVPTSGSENYTVQEIAPPEKYIPTAALEQNKYIVPAKENPDGFTFYYKEGPPNTVNLKFYTTKKGFLADYTGIRIGEYYWMNKNFSHKIPDNGLPENDYPISQQVLDRYVERIRIDKSYFKLNNIDDFEKYYGRYYSYGGTLHMSEFGYMENESGEKDSKWKLPYPADFRQLFAMCPFNTSQDQAHTTLNERDVRFALSAKAGDNPMAYDLNTGHPIYKTYWFDTNHVTNMYKFGLMPGGARLNGWGSWCNTLGPVNGCYTDGVAGDIYHLFYTSYFATNRPDDFAYVGAVILHDYVDTQANLTYHFLNVRWCKKLSDEELGYKLYINKASFTGSSLLYTLSTAQKRFIAVGLEALIFKETSFKSSPAK